MPLDHRAATADGAAKWRWPSLPLRLLVLCLFLAELAENRKHHHRYRPHNYQLTLSIR